MIVEQKQEAEVIRRELDAVQQQLEVTLVRPVDSVYINGRSWYVIYMCDSERLTDPCPFCGKRHSHSRGDGPRVIHCGKVKVEGKEINEYYLMMYPA